MRTVETHRENSLFYAPNSITTSSYVAPAAATPIRYQTPTLICAAQNENLSTDCRRPGEEHVCSFARQTYNQHTHVHKFQFFKQGANPTKTAITHCHPPNSNPYHYNATGSMNSGVFFFGIRLEVDSKLKTHSRHSFSFVRVVHRRAFDIYVYSCAFEHTFQSLT